MKLFQWILVPLCTHSSETQAVGSHWTLFQWIFVPLCTLFAVATLYRLKRGHLGRRQGLLWAILWTIGAVLIAIPRSTAVVASWLQIGRGADLIFYLAILAGLGVCLYFYGWVRRLEIAVTELVRYQAVHDPQRGIPADRHPDDRHSPDEDDR